VPPNGLVWRVARLAALGTFALLTTFLIAFALRDGPRDVPTTVAAARTRIATAEELGRAAQVRTTTASAHLTSARADVAVTLRAAMQQRQRVRVVSARTLEVRSMPAAVPEVIEVPEAVVERIRVDSAAITTLAETEQWEDCLIAALRDRIAADSMGNVATRVAMTALERERHPRCGRRCGVALGVAGVVAAGIVLDQTRKVVGLRL
jgi:hypothetical protein